MNSLSKLLLAAGSVVALGTVLSLTASLEHPLRSSVRRINNEFGLNSREYKGHEVFSGYNPKGMRVVKIYGPITQTPGGEDYRDMVAGVDMNRDGGFQQEELVDQRSTYMGKIILLDNCPKEFGGTLSEFANPSYLEEVFYSVSPKK